MRAIAIAFVITLLAVACQRSEPASKETVASRAEPVEPAPAAADDEYKGDVDRICNAESKSGALEMDEAARSMHVAQWLGANIKTDGGRQFLANIARAKPAEKAKLLRSESKRLGLGSCALATTWSGGGESTL